MTTDSGSLALRPSVSEAPVPPGGGFEASPVPAAVNGAARAAQAISPEAGARTIASTDLVDADANPASPKDLIDLYTRMAEATLIAQGRALVVSRQVDLNAISDPIGIAAQAALLQRRTRKNAGFYLSRITRDAVHGFGNADAAGNLFRAMKARLDAGADPGKTVAAVSGAFEKYYLEAKDFAAETARIRGSATGDADSFASALEEAVGKIDGPDGALASAKSAIDQTETAIEGNLNELVASAKSLGKGAEKLVTYALTTVRISGSTKSDQEKEAEKKKAESGGTIGTNPAQDPDKKPEEKIDPFPVEAIGTVSDGSEGVVAAVNAFKANNRRLGELYQSMAELSALLAASRALGGQARAFADGLSALAAAADGLATTWGGLVGDFDRLARELARTDDTSAERAAWIAAVNAGSLHWSRLQTRLRALEDSLAGMESFFPEEAPADA